MASWQVRGKTRYRRWDVGVTTGQFANVASTGRSGCESVPCLNWCQMRRAESCTGPVAWAGWLLVALGLLLGMAFPSAAAAAFVRLPTSQDMAASPVPARGADAAYARSYFGARYYRPDIGRFTTIDPVYTWQENLVDPQRWNRYAYVRNNPLKYVDPNGRWIETLWDIANVVMGAKSAVDNFRAGNILSGVVDTGGAIVDLAAAVVQVVPGGVGTAIKAARAVDKIDDAVDGARESRTVIGRVKDLQDLKPGERSLLDRLPDRGSPKANWHQNSGVLREEMKRGLAIRDASPGDRGGQLLNAERNLLRDRGWTFDPNTNLWMPPKR